NTVQLGATVDYAILLSERYLQKRQTLFKMEAAKQTIAETAPSILTSAGILTMAGVMIGVISSNAVVSQLGTVLGRGAAFSCIMVLLFLPAMLLLCDRILPLTTRHTSFIFPEKKKSAKSSSAPSLELSGKEGSL
ncbi:MAG: MMPL family transporter, partial [Pygmaiobacter sp.]